MPELDLHNISKIYKDSTRTDKAKDWLMGFGDFKDRMPAGPWGLSNNKGKLSGTEFDNQFEWKAKPSDNVRLSVRTGHPIDIPTLNRKELAVNKDADGVRRGGFMSKSSDWRDVEITCYLYLFEVGGDDAVGWYARGNRHSNSPPKVSCEGSKYEPAIVYKTGEFDVNKESAHGGKGKNFHRKRNDLIEPLGNCVGKWFGYKAIIYNLPSIGTYNGTAIPIFPVKIEVWIDELDNQTDKNSLIPMNNWKKRMETVDNPVESKWGNDGGCKGVDGITLSWGGPVVTFRADKNSNNDGYSHFLMRKVSVREILPGQQVDPV
jgi:hypothetical protein